jgi:hypothetical protein
MNVSAHQRLGLRSLAHRFLTPLILLAAFAASAQAGETSFRHKYLMRGQVLQMDASTLVVCVGKADGAEVGQVLDVVRHVPVMGSNPKEAGPRFRRVDVGSVKVTSLFDDHYATAEVVEGSPKVNDTVELTRP